MILNTKLLGIYLWNLKIANPSGHNVVINNLHPIILIFSKNIEKIE